MNMDESKKRCAIGVDFGGTFVKMARVDERGAIGARASFSTAGLKGVPGWLDEVERHVGSLLADMPRASANTSATRATNAGSFTFPRNGLGVK